MNKRAVGNLGESLACAHLEQKGIVVLERNFRCPAGEIDIIAREKRTLLFIEVKARSSLRYGRPAEAVNRAKQLKILRSAQLYLTAHGNEDTPVRFDVIEVLPKGVRHIRAAFDATDLSEF